MPLPAIIGAVLPWLTAALKSPLAGMAVEHIAEKFGLEDKTVEGVQKFIQGASHAEMLELKKEDHNFELQMKELGFKQIKDLEELAAKDRDSARNREIQTKDPTTRQLALAYTTGFFAIITVVIFKGLPPENRDVIVALLGVLGAAEVSIIQYYFGSSSGSSEKNGLFTKLVDAVRKKKTVEEEVI